MNLLLPGLKASVHILEINGTLCTFQSSISHRFSLISCLLVIHGAHCVWWSLLFACGQSVLPWDSLKALAVLDSSTLLTALLSQGPQATGRQLLSLCAVYVSVTVHVHLHVDRPVSERLSQMCFSRHITDMHLPVTADADKISDNLISLHIKKKLRGKKKTKNSMLPLIISQTDKCCASLTFVHMHVCR